MGREGGKLLVIYDFKSFCWFFLLFHFHLPSSPQWYYCRCGAEKRNWWDFKVQLFIFSSHFAEETSKQGDLMRPALMRTTQTKSKDFSCCHAFFFSILETQNQNKKAYCDCVFWLICSLPPLILSLFPRSFAWEYANDAAAAAATHSRELKMHVETAEA